MKNNRGIILSTYVYLLLVFFLLLLGTMLAVLNNTKILANKMKESSASNIEIDGFNIILLGDGEITLQKGQTFTDPGYTAQTSEGENLTATIDGTVNVNKEGKYILTYKVRYKGKLKKVSRTVSVVDKVVNFSYTGNYQEWTAPVTGWYQIELWGASGNNNYNAYVSANPSYGGYTSGIINLSKGEKIYIYVGGQSVVFNCCANQTAAAGSGGATDIRIVNGVWNDITSLRSRIMVAGGAGGTYADSSGNVGNSGGGLYSGYHTGTHGRSAATQILGGDTGTNGTASGFGYGGTNSSNNYNSGAGGYYGGGSGPSGGGGSSFISGYAGSNAVSSELSTTASNNTMHYSGKYFINGIMTPGVNSGNGKAKITYLSDYKPARVNTNLNNVRYIKDCMSGNNSDSINRWQEIQAIYNGTNVAKGLIPTVVGGGTITKAEYITNGDIGTVGGTDGYSSSSCIVIDLGRTYNLDEVAVWHNWHPSYSQTKSTVTSVSSDNSTWRTVINKIEVETSQGKRVNAYTYKNLLINGSIENSMNEWAIAGINLSLSNLYSKDGNYSIQNYHSNQYNSLMSDAIPAVAGHKYYVGSYSYTVNKGNGCMYSDLNIIYDSASHWLGVEGCQENLNKWELLSGIREVPNGNSPTLSIAIANTTSTNNLQEGYGDGAFIIDLTETFGVGNEPTKEWCDANIAPNIYYE